MSVKGTAVTPWFQGHRNMGDYQLSMGARYVAETLSRILMSGQPAAVDIEGEGLTPPASDMLHCVGVGTVDTVAVVDPRDPEQFDLLRTFLKACPALVFHTSAFDVPILYRVGLFPLEALARVWDTVIWARALEPSQVVSKGLEDCAVRYLGRPKGADLLTAAAKAEKITKSELFRRFDLDRPLYVEGNAADVVTTAKLFPLLRAKVLARFASPHPFESRRLDGDEIERMVDREQIINRGRLRRSCLGFAVDFDFADRFVDENASRLASVADTLTTGHDVKPAESASLVRFLVKDGFEFPPDWPRLKNGEPSGGKKFLERVGHPVVKMFLEHKEATKTQRDYLEKMRDMSVNGRIHPAVQIFGASATGRMSMGSPPIQQFPAGARGMILFDDGDEGVSIDWSQIEPVTAANLAGDHGILAPFEAGLEKMYDTIARAASISYKQAKVCVPLDTQILTQRGWLRHDQVAVGDKTPAHDGTWTTVRAIHRPGPSPLVRMWHKNGFDVLSTPNHRWATCRRQRPGRSGGFAMRTTEDLRQEDNLVLSAVSEGGSSPLSPRDAAVLGWVLTEGTLRFSEITGRTSQRADGSRAFVYATITQSKPHRVKEIDHLLKGVPHNRYVSNTLRPEQSWSQVVWVLSSPWARDMLNRAGVGRDGDPLGAVLSMSPKAREAFVQAGLHGDGNLHRTTWCFTQNEGPVLEAFRVAFHLSGFFVRSSLKSRAGDVTSNGFRSNKDCYVLRLSRPKTTMQRMRREDAAPQEVWCVTTDAGTWTMRQGDQVMITGNCLLGDMYGQGIPLLSSNLNVNEDEARRLKDRVHEAMPVTRAYFDQIKAAANRHLMSVTVSGRLLPVPWKWENGRRRVSGHIAVNQTIQGSAYDILAECLWQTEQWGLGGGVYLAMHDELVVSNAIADIVERLMQTPPPALIRAAGRVPVLRTDRQSMGERWAYV